MNPAFVIVVFFLLIVGSAWLDVLLSVAICFLSFVVAAAIFGEIYNSWMRKRKR